jgi:hypothetical protein
MNASFLIAIVTLTFFGHIQSTTITFKFYTYLDCTGALTNELTYSTGTCYYDSSEGEYFDLSVDGDVATVSVYTTTECSDSEIPSITTYNRGECDYLGKRATWPESASSVIIGAVLGVIIPVICIAAVISFVVYRRRMALMVSTTTIQTQPQPQVTVVSPTMPQNTYYAQQPVYPLQI